MQNHRKKLTPFLALILALSVGATTALAFPKGGGMPGAAAPAAAPAAAETPDAAPAAVPKITKGKVIETMNSGGYTYLCIENEGQKRWAAIPEAEVKVGQDVELAGGMEMGKFHSKTLDRDFDSIYFCSGLVNAPGTLPHPIPAEAQPGKPDAAAMPPGHPPMPANPAAEKPAANAMAGSSQITGKIVETMDAGGYTYAAVEQNGQRSWVALPPTKLDVGQEVEFVPGFVMNNFSSKALDRTFEAITFSSGVKSGQ